MQRRDKIVVGYFAYFSPMRVVCTDFGEIMQGLELGAAYAFDKESYARFYPLALEAGLPVAAADFEAQRLKGGGFFTVRLALR